MTDEPKGDYYTAPQAGDFAEAGEPFALFEAWFADARAHEPNDANAWRSPASTRRACPTRGWCC